MTLKELLSHPVTYLLASKKPVICFYGSTYPLLCISALLHNSYPNNQMRVLHPGQEDKSTILGNLQTSFLGQGQAYCLGNLSELPVKDMTEWIMYAKHYYGPNQLIFFLADSDLNAPDHWLTVKIPEVVDEALLVLLMGPSVTMAQKQQIHFICQRFPKLAVDTAYNLANYIGLLRSGAQQFNAQWLDKLVSSEQSLFQLSQHFFAKNGQTFARQWIKIKDDFPIQFWLSFWSDQIWRAAFFVKYSRQADIVQAKKISYKLPFSFMQRDWRSYSYTQLVQAHHFLYDLDRQIKNGNSEYGLDLFLSKFFANQFV